LVKENKINSLITFVPFKIEEIETYKIKYDMSTREYDYFIHRISNLLELKINQTNSILISLHEMKEERARQKGEKIFFN